MIVVILNQIALLVEYIALIVAVDRILDMARISLNITFDLVVVKIADQMKKCKNIKKEKNVKTYTFTRTYFNALKCRHKRGLGSF